jgi:hypothetical protein
MWCLVGAAFAFSAATVALEWHRAGPAIGIVRMRHLLEGVALFAVVLEITWARPALAFQLIRLLAISGATMALASSRWTANATGVGLYCALVVGGACGMAASARGRRRLEWSIAAVLIVAGLVAADSRSALVWVVSVVAVTALWGRLRDNYVGAGLLSGVLAFLIDNTVARSGIVDEWMFPFWIVLALAVDVSRVGRSYVQPRSR